jgi:hypothetical protein
MTSSALPLAASAAADVEAAKTAHTAAPAWTPPVVTKPQVTYATWVCFFAWVFAVYGLHPLRHLAAEARRPFQVDRRPADQPQHLGHAGHGHRRVRHRPHRRQAGPAQGHHHCRGRRGAVLGPHGVRGLGDRRVGRRGLRAADPGALAGRAWLRRAKHQRHLPERAVLAGAHRPGRDQAARLHLLAGAGRLAGGRGAHGGAGGGAVPAGRALVRYGRRLGAVLRVRHVPGRRDRDPRAQAGRDAAVPHRQAHRAAAAGGARGRSAAARAGAGRRPGRAAPHRHFGNVQGRVAAPDAVAGAGLLPQLVRHRHLCRAGHLGARRLGRHAGQGHRLFECAAGADSFQPGRLPGLHVPRLAGRPHRAAQRGGHRLGSWRDRVLPDAAGTARRFLAHRAAVLAGPVLPDRAVRGRVVPGRRKFPEPYPSDRQLFRQCDGGRWARSRPASA